MNNFKVALKQELQRDVPFTNELKNELIQITTAKKKKQHGNRKTFLAIGAVMAVTVCMIVFFKMMPSSSSDYLIQAANVPSEAEEILKMLKENEPTLSIVNSVNENQFVVADANTKLTGRLMNFAGSPLVVDKQAEIQRGDYVLIEKNHEQYIRQVVGLADETYMYEAGNLQVNGKQVMLPDMIAMDLSKLRGLNLEREYYYFNINPTYLHDVEEKKIATNRFLVHATHDEKMLEEVSVTNVRGKVVGLYEVKPTFIVQGEEAKLLEAFKQSKNPALLINVDPVTILKMFNTALLEKDYGTMYAMQVNYVWAFNVSLTEYMQTFAYEEFSMEEMNLLYAVMYNGLEEATVTYNSAKTEAYVVFGANNRMITLILNKEGFWEFKIG